MRFVHIIYTVLITITLVSCQSEHKKADQISVSIIPQKFFVHQIAGDTLNVNVMIPPGGSPATYEPTPKQMQSLSQSTIYFRVGPLGFEKAWIDKFASVNPAMKIINTSVGLDLVADEEFDLHKDHNHTQDHDHSHEGYNPHIWLSPTLVKHQADIMYNALAEQYPSKKEAMHNNLTRFKQKCDSVESILKNNFESRKGYTFIVYHPVWTYLAKDLGLKQVSIEHNGKEATADKLKQIIDFAKTNDIHTIFVQQEFSGAQAKTIAKEIDGKAMPLNPLAYEWFESMNAFNEAFNNINY